MSFPLFSRVAIRSKLTMAMLPTMASHCWDVMSWPEFSNWCKDNARSAEIRLTLLGVGSGMQFCIARDTGGCGDDNMGQFCDFRNERGHAVSFGDESINARHFTPGDIACA